MSQDQSMYYVSLNEKVQGPYTFAQLQQLMITNQITRKTQVLLQGSPSWINAQQIPGLFPQFHAEEPPVASNFRPNPNPRPVPPLASSFPVNPNSELSLDFNPPKPRRAVLLEEEDEEDDERYSKPNVELNSKWLYGLFTILFPGVGHLFLNQYMKGILFFIILGAFRGLRWDLLTYSPESATFSVILGIPHSMLFTYVFLDCMATYDKIAYKLNPKKVLQKQLKHKKKSFNLGDLKFREKVFVILWVLYIVFLLFLGIAINSDF